MSSAISNKNIDDFVNAWKMFLRSGSSGNKSSYIENKLIVEFSAIAHYAATQTSNAAYIIGGLYTPDVIAEYKDGQWRQLPNLYRGRTYHGAITIGGQTMIIGGSDFSDYLSPMETEIWEFDNGGPIQRKIIHTSLRNNYYAQGTALFEVDANYCKNVTGKSLRF